MHLIKFVIFLHLVLFCCVCEVRNSKNASVINAFVLPHSHDDVGWLLTIDDYYYYFVQHIYNQVVEALSVSTDRRFISVEMAYFYKWWTETATEIQQEQARKLVSNGQLEFIIGGWTMQDETCTTYSTNIDQMSEGHQFIYNTFGVRPRFGWQIDPFGASNVVHEHFADMGFDATVIDRVPDQIKRLWQQDQTMEFVWNPSASSSVQIFTHLMDEALYINDVDGLEWDRGSTPVTDLNKKFIAERIVDDIKKRRQYFQSNIFLLPWGDDFEFTGAMWNFDNMDKLIKCISWIQRCVVHEYNI